MKKSSLIKLIVPLLAVYFSPLAAGQSAELEALVDAIAEENVGTNIAGLSVGVTRGNEVLLKKSYGYANIEWQVPMPMDAVHEIGSVTKQFTSVAALQLYGQERLNLDADISEYLPDFDLQGRQIPVRRLVDHTSGIKGFTEIPEFRDLFSQTKPREDLLRLIESYPFDFEPGEALIYNNSGYFLLGLIIEEVSGQSYEDYIEENIFTPAGMDDSSYCSNSNIVANKANGYQASSDGLQIASYHDHTWPYAAGSLCSTISDLLAWNQALHNGQVLSPALYDLLITPVPLADGTAVRYAMGVNHYDHPTGRVIEHGGGIDGFLSHSRYYPDDDVTIVVLQNTGGPPGPAAVANQIGEHLFGLRNEPQTQTFTGDLSSYAGSYMGPARGTKLTATVAPEGEELTISISSSNNNGPAQALTYQGNNTFMQGPVRFIFEGNAGSSFATLRMDSPGSHYVLERIDD